jgi:hypothetical protein
MKKSQQHDNKVARMDHKKVKNQILLEKEKWKSHSVLVVDMSGSMRQDDVNGARCRSDGVWTVLARDFVMKKLEERSVSINDVVSVILMKDTATVVCRYEPITWVLYNRLVDLREWTTEKPCGDGCYLPALEKAEEVLLYNPNCPVLGLLFFSDGKPSDRASEKSEITTRMGEIASRFGRRLVVSFIGIADKRKEDFSILKEMATEAKAFGCTSEFRAPDLSTTSLSSIVSSLNSSMTSTKTELTDLKTGRLRTVRTDVLREKQGTPDDIEVNQQWNVFLSTSETKYPKDVYVWNSRKSDFATLVNPRCFSCYSFVGKCEADQSTSSTGLMCPRCKACYACFACLGAPTWFGGCKWSRLQHGCEHTAHLRRNGLIVEKSLPSFNVAYKKTAFGEGAERLAFKFRFVAQDGKTFIGPKMVAKESRFIETGESEDEGGYLLSDRFSYHKQFMRTQAIASRFADIYNTALDSLTEWNEWSPQYPRVRFLDPMIFEIVELKDGEKRTSNILVEPMIEGKYRKFNTNNGKIGAIATTRILESDVGDTGAISRKTVDSLLHRGAQENEKISAEKTLVDNLHVIEEGSEDEYSDSDKEEGEEKTHVPDVFHQGKNSGFVDQLVAESADLAPSDQLYGKIPDEYFAQAFSHYSYVRSGGQLMVVDLQGVLKVNKDKTREFVFTDPAIHKRKRAMGNAFLRQLNLGRTNRGREGMDDFWNTHICSDACRVLGLRPRRKYGQGVAEAIHSTNMD